MKAVTSPVCHYSAPCNRESESLDICCLKVRVRNVWHPTTISHTWLSPPDPYPTLGKPLLIFRRSHSWPVVIAARHYSHSGGNESVYFRTLSATSIIQCRSDVCEYRCRLQLSALTWTYWSLWMHRQTTVHHTFCDNGERPRFWHFFSCLVVDCFLIPSFLTYIYLFSCQFEILKLEIFQKIYDTLW